LFGIAPVVDLNDLHATVNDLHKKQDSIVHATNHQVTYFKQLDGTVKFNHEAITNLSVTLKGIVMKAQGDLQEVALKLLRNSTHIEAAEIIRQLEFALTQLELSIDELMFPLQYVQLGKIPLNLISSSMLRDMWQKVSLVLPGGYDLIFSLRPNNVFIYCEMIQAAMLANLHSFKLLMIVPLKTVNVQFTLYRVAVLLVRLFNHSFVQFEVEKVYFGIDVLQRHYLTLTEVDLVKCRVKDFYICPADHAIYSTEINSCVLSLFQSTKPQETCGRRVTSRLPQPRFDRFGSTMLYYLPERQMVFLQCQQSRTSETHSLLLQEGGLFLNAASCSFTSKGLQMSAALQGESQYSSPGPTLFTPTNSNFR
jgi:hypothetical protein